MEFVENYRRLTRIPLPKKEKVELGTLLRDLKNLFPDNFIHILPPSSEIYLQADRVQIEQVLINLVRNAREACNAVEWDERNCNPGGGDSAVCPNAAAVDGAGSGANAGAGCIGPRIEVSVFHHPEWRVALSVADNGEGILPEVLDKIFVPFFTTKEGGSGIGLSLCRQIMHLHGGSITATSTPGTGTCFTLLFP
ncbi:MAG: HAMP domain-containing histidine kinase [Bacteroidales bacterium]|nr:HAMP domain-containing histidine kinase [Bacteroidales bacterium]